MKNRQQSIVLLSIILVSLGYFVDIYDLLLFTIVKEQSLRDIGVPQNNLLKEGQFLLQLQMLGTLFGGIFWGIMGDKRGRLWVLFVSIIIYSFATFANGFVSQIWHYQLLRFLAGVGLAGELGVGVALICEIMSKKNRGFGTLIVATVGFWGAIAAYLVNQEHGWRTSYFIGGALGLGLVILRVAVMESAMFEETLLSKKVKMGSFLMLFEDQQKSSKYLKCILIGVPTWFVIGILVNLAPQFTQQFGMKNAPQDAGLAIVFCYAGMSIGNFLCGILSEFLKSRRKALIIFHIFLTLAVLFYLNSGNMSLPLFYFKIFLMGIGIGFWIVFVSVAAEQFGTNIRATVTVTATNFVRAALWIFTWATFSLGSNLLKNAFYVAIISLLIAIVSAYLLPETYDKSLDYVD